MKKIIALLIVMTMCFSAICVFAANGEIGVYLEGNKISFDVPPQTLNDRTMVPIRAIFEAMGATVTWEESTQTAICIKENTTVKMTVDSTVEYINDVPYTMDVSPVIIGGRTLAPARYVAEAFGYNVNWDNATNSVLINKALAVSNETIYSDDNIEVKYSGIDDPGTGMNMFRMTLNVENKFEKNILIYLDECYINDSKVNVLGGNADFDGIKPYKKAACRFLLTYDPAEISKIDDINKIEFKINIKDKDFENMLTTDTITLEK